VVVVVRGSAIPRKMKLDQKKKKKKSFACDPGSFGLFGLFRDTLDAVGKALEPVGNVLGRELDARALGLAGALLGLESLHPPGVDDRVRQAADAPRDAAKQNGNCGQGVGEILVRRG
jgi:hypothetical protein